MALSPNGKWALFGYRLHLGNGEPFNAWAKLWDVEEGKEICTLEGVDYTPHFLAFLPDSKTAVVASHDAVLRFYQVPSGKLLRTLRVHGGYLATAVLSPDGTHALTAGFEKNLDGRLFDGTVKVWDLTQTLLLHTWETNASPPHGISPDNRLAVAGSQPVTVYDLKTGKTVRQLPVADGWVGKAHFAADGKRLLTTKYLTSRGNGEPFQVVLCEPETGKVLWESEGGLQEARFASGEQFVLAWGSKETWHILDAATGKTLRSFKLDLGTVRTETGHDTAFFTAKQLSPDGKTLVGVVGTNRPRWPVGSMVVQVWHLGRVPTLVRTWPDPTRGVRT
jgi:WD40 repeat protein